MMVGQNVIRIEYRLPLDENRSAKLLVPIDLNNKDIERIIKFLNVIKFEKQQNENPADPETS